MIRMKRLPSRSYRESKAEEDRESIESASVPNAELLGIADRDHLQEVTLLSFNVSLSVMVQRIEPGGL